MKTKRVHIAVNCSNLQNSILFYNAFFNAVPSKAKPDYAKYELEETPLHFSLNVSPFQSNGVLNHLGFQVDSSEDVLLLRNRMMSAGLMPLDEMNTTCCYAVQDKFWLHDPDGNAWEIFYTKADSEFESAQSIKRDSFAVPKPLPIKRSCDC